MPRRNKIELQGLVERIVDMFFKEKKTQIEIAEQLKSEGFDISKSGVGRTLLSRSAQMKAYRDAAKQSVAIVQELKNTPGLDIAEATVQMVQAKLLQEVKKFPDFKELDTKEVIRAVSQNSLAQTRIAKVKLEYERGYRKGLFAAAGVLEKEGKKAGWSEETVNAIRGNILGLKVDYD